MLPSEGEEKANLLDAEAEVENAVWGVLISIRPAHLPHEAAELVVQLVGAHFQHIVLCRIHRSRFGRLGVRCGAHPAPEGIDAVASYQGRRANRRGSDQVAFRRQPLAPL